MLHIGIDDTDSLEGGCTTWLITEVIKELSDFDLVGPPRLVRLNPNVPWKTRGNGALALVFGKGRGSKKLVGEIDNSRIFMYSEYEEKLYDKKSILERISKLVINNSKIESQPGIVISDSYLPEGLYWQGV
ncbi:MAG TPA: DNA-binding protein, partial [Candidatus Poseidoniia archaeon]|nr:DNA-binding protein [Candidatus Poseidoniia archaeon]